MSNISLIFSREEYSSPQKDQISIFLQVPHLFLSSYFPIIFKYFNIFERPSFECLNIFQIFDEQNISQISSTEGPSPPLPKYLKIFLKCFSNISNIWQYFLNISQISSREGHSPPLPDEFSIFNEMKQGDGILSTPLVKWIFEFLSFQHVK